MHGIPCAEGDIIIRPGEKATAGKLRYNPAYRALADRILDERSVDNETVRRLGDAVLCAIDEYQQDGILSANVFYSILAENIRRSGVCKSDHNDIIFRMTKAQDDLFFTLLLQLRPPETERPQ